MFPIEDIPVKLADGSQIISFGKFGDDPYVVKLVKETRLNDRTGEKETVYTEKSGKATTSDKAALRRASDSLPTHTNLPLPKVTP